MDFLLVAFPIIYYPYFTKHWKTSGFLKKRKSCSNPKNIRLIEQCGNQSQLQGLSQIIHSLVKYDLRWRKICGLARTTLYVYKDWKAPFLCLLLSFNFFSSWSITFFFIPLYLLIFRQDHRLAFVSERSVPSWARCIWSRKNSSLWWARLFF